MSGLPCITKLCSSKLRLKCCVRPKMLGSSTATAAANGLFSGSHCKNMNCAATRLWERSAKKKNISQTSHGGKKSTWHTKVLIVWIVLALTVAFRAFLNMNADIVERRKEMLVSMCDERARMLQEQFLVSLNHVHALAILVSTFHHRKNPSAIDQRTFAEYTARTSFERPLMSGVAYARKVVHSDRELFEQEQGWTIKMMKSRQPSPAQDEYAPAIFSQQTLWYIQSLDLLSGDEDRENILRARATGKGVLTSPFRLLESNHLGVVLTFAVYNTDLPPNATPEERIQATAGYLGGAFDVESLVENLLRQLAGNVAIGVSVYDVTNASMPLIMYGPEKATGDIMHVSTLDFGDPVRKHEMRCRYLDRPPLPWSAITSSVGGFVIAFLIGYILHAAVTHIAKVQEDFRKMEELKMKAEEADIAKSQFLATVSHEIRTPMNGVLGMLQMLLDTDMDATQVDYARTAQTSGKALIALINEVLDRAKIESGKLELESVPFDLRLILDDVLSLFSGESRDKGIELAVFVSDQVPEILVGDPGRFRQIVTNLVGNSVKFIEHGHIFVHVNLAENLKSIEAIAKRVAEDVRATCTSTFNTLSGLQAADGKNSWEIFKLLLSNSNFLHGQNQILSLQGCDTVNLIVSVEDTGIGIPIHAQKRIFTPFMQADSSTSRTYGGTGIGLSISRCLVELMGGEINFVSSPGIGSTFSFTAPFKMGNARSSDDMKKSQSESLPTTFKGMTAVVIDGRQVRAEVTRYHLQRLGVKVEIAHDVNSALLLINEKRHGYLATREIGVDMILVDKDAWGHMTGIDFPKLLKDSMKNESLPLLKMLLLATSITSVESEKARTAGFLETIIMKPLRASTVASCLQQALGLGNVTNQCKGVMNGTANIRSLLHGKKILVVDDNKVNRIVAAAALKKFGANVECADSGKAAIEMLQFPHKFDACFMDIQMPEMDGFEATRKIRNMEESINQRIELGAASMEDHGMIRKWHIPIFAMTADVIQTTHEECLRYGMDGYVPKPFSEDELFRVVAQFFESFPST